MAPKPRPNTASASAAAPTGVAVVQPDITTSATIDAMRPASVTSRSDTTRTMNPDDRAPTAVAPARAPSARRWSSGPPYSTRSTNTAAPTIAVARPYPVSSDTAVAEAKPGVAEQPRVEERVAHPQPAHDRGHAGDDRDDRQHGRDDRRVGPSDAGSAWLPSSVSAPSPPTRNAENRMPPTMSRRPGRRGVSQPLLAAHATTSAMIPIGTLT